MAKKPPCLAIPTLQNDPLAFLTFPILRHVAEEGLFYGRFITAGIP